jgi:hypothetical protein
MLGMETGLPQGRPEPGARYGVLKIETTAEALVERRRVPLGAATLAASAALNDRDTCTMMMPDRG